MNDNDDPHLLRPANISKRDLIIGLLTATLVDAQVPGALRIASKACEELTRDYLPDMRRWFPLIGPQHAKLAIIYAGRAYRYKALTKEEYDWVCLKARMAILRAVEHPSTGFTPSFALADFPGRLGTARERNDNEHPDPPDAA